MHRARDAFTLHSSRAIGVGGTHLVRSAATRGIGSPNGANLGGGGGTTPPPTCAHSDCTTGAALTSGCNSCVTSICAQDSFCCNNSWDNICVGEVGSICGQICP